MRKQQTSTYQTTHRKMPAMSELQGNVLGEVEEEKISAHENIQATATRTHFFELKPHKQKEQHYANVIEVSNSFVRIRVAC